MKKLLSKQILMVSSFILISVFVLTGCPQQPGELLFDKGYQEQAAQQTEKKAEPYYQPAAEPIPEQQTEIKEAPVMAPTPAPEPPMMVSGPSSHTVVRGECLWVISGYSQVYNDPFQWPLIYKANRHQIKDPDLIFPGQVLTITRDNPESEKNSAIKFAKTRGDWSLTDGRVLEYNEVRAFWEE